jgi:hypothetical protein
MTISDPPQATTVEPVAPAPRRNLVPILIAALAAALVAVIVLVVVLTAGGNDESAAAETFTLNGSMAMKFGDVSGAGDQCAGSGGYDDIRKGAQVTVYDDKGAVVGTSALTGSSFGTDSGCTWFFQVEVPAGPDFYQVEVSHRGKITVTPEEAKAGAVELTLG